MAALSSGGGAAPGKPALAFIGFMGAGKSSALAAARAAGLETADSDELLERDLGCSIAEFFEREGEDAFRRREERLVADLLERAEGGAIALGGGAVMAEPVQLALARHVTVWLQVDVEDAWERAGGSRPLARDREQFEQLFAEREALYAFYADAVLPPGDPRLVERALPSLLALRDLPEGAQMVWARSDSGEYPAYVARGLLGSGFWPLQGNRFLVSDVEVARLYADAVEPLAARIAVEPGEQAKTLAEAERVIRELARAEMTRDDHVVALGGGVVGDLAGFCAATYQRGVPVVQVPTTLVAQVDSAYGGKTGVDLPEAKNYVGAYHQPAAVLADPATLATLPAAELAAGFVEVVKTALIAGGALWERVRLTEELDPDELDDVIFACARTKLDVVAADERDSGRRQVLNLGHTVGHAIEAATGYERYRHGEAVALGLLAALRLSDAEELRQEVAALLDAHGLPTVLGSDISIGDVLEGIGRDKKRTAEGIGFVLLERPGEPLTGRLVDPDRVRGAVEELQRG